MFTAGLIGMAAILSLVVVHFTSPASYQRLMLFAVVGVIILFGLSFRMIDAAAKIGSEIAQSHLRGEQSLPSVGLITNKPVFITSLSQSRQMRDGNWLYFPSYIVHPETENKVSSIQYIAEVGELLYILENGNSVHVIPMKSVEEMFLFSDSGAMIPRRSITIPSHVPVISSTAPISLTLPFPTVVP